MIRIRTRLGRAFVAAMVLLVCLAPATASAMTVREGDMVTVASGELISDDLYAFGNTITVDGIVDGDLVAFGQNVVIDGEVRGSVLGAAQTVRVNGTVGGSVRAAGALVDVTGQVGGDVIAGASQVTVSGSVGRDLAAGSADVRISGGIVRNVVVGANYLTIDGQVGGNVGASVNRVTVTKQGSVGGDLDYWSDAEADIQGTVAGTTTRHEPQTQTQRPTGLEGFARTMLGAALAWIQSFMGFLLLGLFMVFAVRRPTDGGSAAAIVRPWPSLGLGLAAFFGTPMAAGFLFVVGLFIGTWWLAFVLMMAYWLLLLAGVVVGSLAVGRAIMGKVSSSGEPALAWSLVLGLVVVWVVGAIPFIGWILGWLVMTAGVGGLLLLWMGKAEKPTAVPAVYVPQPPPAAVPPPPTPQPATPPAPPQPFEPPAQPPMA